MISPSFKDFLKLTKQGNLVALRMDIPSDLETPVSAFLKVSATEPCAFLLESAEHEERIGRYSFLGFNPEAILKLTRGNLFLKKGGKSTLLGNQTKLLEIMRQTLSRYRISNSEGLPSFMGGFVGFLGYENVSLFEKVALEKKKGLEADDAVFFLIKEFLLFDHFNKTLSIVALCDVDTKNKRALKAVYARALKGMEQIAKKLDKTISRKTPRVFAGGTSFIRPNIVKQEFKKKIQKIKEYIRAGDCIQVVLSQRFSLGKVQDDFSIYRDLRSINPSPYMFYFRCEGTRLIGSSPEVLVRKMGRSAEIRPIAGTRIRGKSPEEDRKLEENLRNSKKEMAEHLMLVDLGRNDLGRVCEFKSIKVNDFATVERYSHVMHLVSGVTGDLKPRKDAFDLLKATFPAGTVTGAPKIRAMEIIDELEPEKRGPYAGCLGYFSFNQDMDMCITIRTIVITGGQAYVQAGAGVVYDSTPENEYQETLNKARALVQAVNGNSGK